MDRAFVHIYTGDGKGKTTAAVGLSVRAVASGLRVGFYQFLKNGKSAELEALKQLGIAVNAPQSGKFIWDMDEKEKEACAFVQQELLRKAQQAANDLDLLVLDEVICAGNTGMLPQEQLLGFIKARPATLELVMTGRGAGPNLLALADYATEMRLLAHPYEKNVPARRGIEF